MIAHQKQLRVVLAEAGSGVVSVILVSSDAGETWNAWGDPGYFDSERHPLDKVAAISRDALADWRRQGYQTHLYCGRLLREAE